MSSWIWRYTNLVYLFIYLFIFLSDSNGSRREREAGRRLKIGREENTCTTADEQGKGDITRYTDTPKRNALYAVLPLYRR